MNKLLVLATCAVLSVGNVAAQSDSLNLKDITSGRYYAHRIYGVRPANDGNSYTQLSEDSRRIIRRSFKNGEEIGTLFDASTARGPIKLEHIDGYIMSPDESRILLQTKTKSIYRRSFTAEYYIFDVKNNRFTHLSEGGPQQVPVFSPDGTMIAFARKNNLFLVKLLFDNAESQITKDGKFNEVSRPTAKYWRGFAMMKAKCLSILSRNSRALTPLSSNTTNTQVHTTTNILLQVRKTRKFLSKPLI